ncbi:hypothetical protein Tco_0005632 [Tanacetum coccineum]
MKPSTTGPWWQSRTESYHRTTYFPSHLLLSSLVALYLRRANLRYSYPLFFLLDVIGITQKGSFSLKISVNGGKDLKECVTMPAIEVAYVFGQLQNIAASDALSRVLKDVNEHPMARHGVVEALGSIAVRGGNFNALTNEWVDLGYVLSLMDQLDDQCIFILEEFSKDLLHTSYTDIKLIKPEHRPSNRCVCMERSDDVKSDIEQNCCEHVLIVMKRCLEEVEKEIDFLQQKGVQNKVIPGTTPASFVARASF